jgi:hypothetical protein
MISRIEHDDRHIFVDRTKEQTRTLARECDETMHQDVAYRDRLGSYYGEWHDREGGF